MTADTLKTTRVLELYQDFLSGKLINKQKAAEQYHVNVRSIQRDIDSIRDFLSEQCAKEGIVRKIEYDKKENSYRLVTQEIEQLSKGEVLALCKILLESRAFTKEQVEKQLQIILSRSLWHRRENVAAQSGQQNQSDCAGNAGAGDEAGNWTDERPILRRLFYEDGCKRD